ncbi:MAG TPA: hypothetical protein DC049_07195 [Spirochaetia bacterium]|nr:hypothetical protein [Spirochaetia bacterium]
MKDITTEHTTEMIFENINIDTGLRESIFKTSEMTRIH